MSAEGFYEGLLDRRECSWNEDVSRLSQGKS